MNWEVLNSNIFNSFILLDRNSTAGYNKQPAAAHSTQQGHIIKFFVWKSLKNIEEIYICNTFMIIDIIIPTAEICWTKRNLKLLILG